MSNNNQNQRLNGFNVLSYLGSNPGQPTNFTVATSSPTADDSRGFALGDWWLNVSDSSIWYLASTNGLSAVWIQVQGSGTGLLSLQGNFGGEVFPLGGNINIVGDGVTVSIAGNPGTSTLTMMSLGGGTELSLTGNTGGAVSETGGNIDLVGSGLISVSGNPGISTLTLSTSGATSTSFATQAGTAIPVANVLNVVGSNNISTSGAGSTVTVTAGSNIAQSYITSPATATATPAAGALTFSGSGATMSAAGSTVTITGSGGGSLPNYATGTFTPSVLIGGSGTGVTYSGGRRYGVYTRFGNIVFVEIQVSPVYSGGSSSQVSISDLPYTVSNSYGSFTMETTALIWLFNSSKPASVRQDTQYIWGRFTPGSTSMNLWFQLKNLSTGNAIAYAGTNFNSTPNISNLVIQGFYYVD